MLRRFAESIQPFAASLGGPGLVLIAFLDSSFVPLPNVPDLLLVWLVVRQPALWIYYAAITTAASIVGCYAIYLVARKGGEALLKRRFRAGTTERALRIIRRYGLLAVVVPAILPPPSPFKIFVVLAGVSGIPTGPFLAAVAIGRGFRYFGEALLAYRYGDAAIKYIGENLGQVSLWVAAGVAVIGVAVVLWRRRTG